MGTKTLETLVGAAILVVAAAFFAFAYDTADVAHVEGYAVRAEFNSVGGLETGDDVRIAGIKVGTVTALKLDPEWYVASVTMTIDPDISLSEDAFVAIASESLLGGSYVSIQPGGGDEAGEGHVFTRTQGAVDLMDILSRGLFGGVAEQ